MLKSSAQRIGQAHGSFDWRPDDSQPGHTGLWPDGPGRLDPGPGAAKGYRPTRTESGLMARADSTVGPMARADSTVGPMVRADSTRARPRVTVPATRTRRRSPAAAVKTG